MKDYLPLVKQPLPNHVERNFYQAWKRTTKEHGYNGFMAMPRFLYRRFMDHFWQNVSRIVPYSGIRVKLHRWRGVHIGKNVYIGSHCFIDNLYPDYIYIEDNSSINADCMILTHFNPMQHFAPVLQARVAPVIIGKGSVLSVRSTVLPGVTIGEFAIVSAGSIVEKDVPAYTMVRGNPAKIISEFEILMK